MTSIQKCQIFGHPGRKFEGPSITGPNPAELLKIGQTQTLQTAAVPREKWLYTLPVDNLAFYTMPRQSIKYQSFHTLTYDFRHSIHYLGIL